MLASAHFSMGLHGPACEQVNRRRPFSSLLLPGRGGRAKSVGPSLTPTEPRASPAPESSAADSLSDLEAASHSKFPSSRATSADVETERRASPTAAPHPQGSSHRAASTESPSPAFRDSNNKQTAFSLQTPASSALNAQSSAKPTTEPVNDAPNDDEKDSAHNTVLDKRACANTTSAVATSTTITGTSKLRSVATSRPRHHVHELSPKCTQTHGHPPRPPKAAARHIPGRTQTSHRKRAKISIKLGEISSTPAPPTPYDPSAYNGSMHAAHVWGHNGHPDLPPAASAQIFGRPHGETHVATTLSLTSLIHSPSYHGGSATPSGAAALSHGIYIAPTRHLPTGSQRSAARVGAPPPPPRKPPAPFEPPADADEVPQSVRMDRDIINTLHVGRRTSSRYAPSPPRGGGIFLTPLLLSEDDS